MSVKYQVERRPINASGKVYRGTRYGDYITVLTDSSNSRIAGDMSKGGRPYPSSPSTGVPSTSYTSLGESVRVYGAGQPVTELSNSDRPTYSNIQELSGEPWLVHSTHFSIDSALESAAPLAGAIGAENVRIIKVLSHTTMFKLN